MVDFSAPFEFPVNVIGCVASRLLSEPADGEVSALFESTFYLTAGEHTLCVGSHDLNFGPLNVVTTAPSRMNWSASGIRRHARVKVTESEIRIGNRFVFPMTQSSVWSPVPLNSAADPECVRRGLDMLQHFSVPCVPNDGLGRFLFPGYVPRVNDRVGLVAEPLIEQARTWLTTAFANRDQQQLSDTTWVEKLAGLGPGLTPSGDDFLGGVLITLHTLGETDVGRPLWHPIHHQARTAGNAISLAHLAAAAEGVGADGIHNALSAVLRGHAGEIQAAIAAITEIGHTSGWDTMAGVVTTLESWQNYKLVRPRGLEPPRLVATTTSR
jgi:hypothetical protein